MLRYRKPIHSEAKEFSSAIGREEMLNEQVSMDAVCSLAVVRFVLHHRACDRLTNRGESDSLMMCRSLAWLVKGCE